MNQIRSSLSGYDHTRQLGSMIAARTIVLVTLLTTGCASTRTATNRDVNYTKHPNRIFIVGNLDGFGPSFSDEFQKRIVGSIESCGGHAAYSHVSTLELDPTVRQNQAQQFNPDVIISMRLTHTTIDSYGQLLNANVDTQVWDVALKKIVWRGNSAMAAGGMLTPASTRAESLNKDLITKLRSDGLIPSCSAP